MKQVALLNFLSKIIHIRNHITRTLRHLSLICNVGSFILYLPHAPFFAKFVLEREGETGCCYRFFFSRSLQMLSRTF